MPTETIQMTDAEIAEVHKYAQAHGLTGLTDDQVASRMLSEAMVARYRRRFGQPPAKVYSIHQNNRAKP